MKYNVLRVYVMCPLITRNKRRLFHNITHYDYMHIVTRKGDMSVSV